MGIMRWWNDGFAMTSGVCATFIFIRTTTLVLYFKQSKLSSGIILVWCCLQWPIGYWEVGRILPMLYQHSFLVDKTADEFIIAVEQALFGYQPCLSWKYVLHATEGTFAAEFWHAVYWSYTPCLVA